MKSKKAVELATNTIIVFAIVLIVLIVVITIFTRYMSQETEVIGNQIDSLGDCDCDGVANFLDKCPCIPGEDKAELDGCRVNDKDEIKCSKTECDKAKEKCKNNV